MSTREEASRADDDENDDEESDAARRLALIAGSGAEEDVPLEPEPSDSDAGVDPDTDIEEEQSLADDSSRCGDGVLDDNEMCDIGIPSGDEGACPTRCNPEPGCPSETMVVRSCWSYCVPDAVPPPECIE